MMSWLEFLRIRDYVVLQIEKGEFPFDIMTTLTSSGSSPRAAMEGEGGKALLATTRCTVLLLDMACRRISIGVPQQVLLVHGQHLVIILAQTPILTANNSKNIIPVEPPNRTLQKRTNLPTKDKMLGPKRVHYFLISTSR